MALRSLTVLRWR